METPDPERSRGPRVGLAINVPSLEKVLFPATLACLLRPEPSLLLDELGDAERDQIGVNGAELVLSVGLSR